MESPTKSGRATVVARGCTALLVAAVLVGGVAREPLSAAGWSRFYWLGVLALGVIVAIVWFVDAAARAD